MYEFVCDSTPPYKQSFGLLKLIPHSQMKSSLLIDEILECFVKTRKIYEKYKKKSENLKKITFIGRTGLFMYIDMAPAVNIHIKIANDFIKENYS